MVYFAGLFPDSYPVSPKKYVFKVDERDYTPVVRDEIWDFRRASTGYKYSNLFIVTNIFKSVDEAIKFVRPLVLRESDIVEVKVYNYIRSENEIKSNSVFSPLNSRSHKNEEKNTREKENEMNTSVINRDTFKFGKVSTSKLTYSAYGVAVVDNKGRAKVMVDNSIMDVTGFTFDGFPIYQMPVAIKDLKSGDIVLHNGSYMIVVESKKDSFVVIDIANGEDKVVRPFKNVFGFNYMTKVVDLFKMMSPSQDNAMIPSENNPFGNPLMLFAMSGQKMDDDLVMMAMMGMNGNGMNFNMMLPFMLLKDKNSDGGEENSTEGDSFKDLMIPFMMMSMAQNQTSTSREE